MKVKLKWKIFFELENKKKGGKERENLKKIQ